MYYSTSVSVNIQQAFQYWQNQLKKHPAGQYNRRKSQAFLSFVASCEREHRDFNKVYDTLVPPVK